MEEFVGGLWDRFIRKAANRGYPAARVKLEQMAKLAPIFFRALGGDPGVNVTAGTATAHGAQRLTVQNETVCPSDMPTTLAALPCMAAWNSASVPRAMGLEL